MRCWHYDTHNELTFKNYIIFDTAQQKTKEQEISITRGMNMNQTEIVIIQLLIIHLQI